MNGGYHNLEVYQMAHALAVKVHKKTLSLPKFEMFEEASQVRRSAKSVSSNIVEGYVLRKYKNEYLHFLYRAHASSEETVEHITILFETNSLADKDVYDYLMVNYRALNSKLFRFIQAVECHHEIPAYLKKT